MLPQHGGVPNFNLRISGPALLLLILVLISGSMLTLSFYLNADFGDLEAQSRVKLSLLITLVLTLFILLASTGHWWYPHLRQGHSSRHKHRPHGPHSRRRR